MSKYNANGLPWSNGLGQNVSDCVTSQEVMIKAGLDFEVAKCKLVAKMPFRINGNNEISEQEAAAGDFARNGNIYRTCENAYGTYRTDNNIPLGIVKQKYEVTQNIDAFNFFNDAIGEGKALWQTAGLFGYGQKIFVTAKLPIVTSVKGFDNIDNYLVFSNSHDGSSSIDIMFAPIRVICTNMLTFGKKAADSHIRIRHTQSSSEKLENGSRLLKIAVDYAKDSQDIYSALYDIKASDDCVQKYIANLFLSEGEITKLIEFDKSQGYRRLYSKDFLMFEATGISTRKVNQICNVFEYYMDGIGQQKIAGTAWGAYNAVTGFYSNVANLSGEKRMDSLLYGNGQSNMIKAMNAAFDIESLVA